MLAGVAVAQSGTATGPGSSTCSRTPGSRRCCSWSPGVSRTWPARPLFTRMGGLQRSHPALAGLFGLGLAALAGVPPLGGFWSKEAVLTAAEQAARDGRRLARLGGARQRFAHRAGHRPVRGAGLRPGGLGPAAEGAAEHHAEHPSLPSSMIWPLWLLAVPTALLGLLLIHPPALLAATHVDPLTAFTGAILSLAGIGWALSAPRLGTADIALALPDGVRAFLRDGYRLDDVQQAVVVRPYRVLARLVGAGDREVVDAYPRGLVVAVRWAGLGLRRFGDGMATSYVGVGGGRRGRARAGGGGAVASRTPADVVGPGHSPPLVLVPLLSALALLVVRVWGAYRRAHRDGERHRDACPGRRGGADRRALRRPRRGRARWPGPDLNLDWIRARRPAASWAPGRHLRCRWCCLPRCSRCWSGPLDRVQPTAGRGGRPGGVCAGGRGRCTGHVPGARPGGLLRRLRDR
ncbi:MAG: hypothetical protein IPG94_22065, partial [Kineosporiaceae bacterium]|nr:hypothetical protein [Kineosporiaceae bacterium]